MSAERLFFTAMAFAVLISTFVGFMPSYYLRGLTTPYHPLIPLTPLVHLHALVFSAWVLLFAAQTSLVAVGRVDLHRKLGLGGMALIAAMIPLAVLAALYGVHRPTAPPGFTPLQWLAVPLLDIPIFGGLIVAALIKRRDSQWHKRLMLLGMICMMQPSLGRMPMPFPLPIVLAALFLVPLAIWDWRTRGRLHPATLWGGLIVLLGIFGKPLIWDTPAWLAFARWASELVV